MACSGNQTVSRFVPVSFLPCESLVADPDPASYHGRYSITVSLLLYFVKMTPLQKIRSGCSSFAGRTRVSRNEKYMTGYKKQRKRSNRAGLILRGSPYNIRQVVKQREKEREKPNSVVHKMMSSGWVPHQKKRSREGNDNVLLEETL